MKHFCCACRGWKVTYFADAQEWYCSEVSKLPGKLKEFKVSEKCMNSGLHDHNLSVASRRTPATQPAGIAQHTCNPILDAQPHSTNTIEAT